MQIIKKFLPLFVLLVVILPVANIAVRDDSEKNEVIIIYDSTDITVLKSEALFTNILDDKAKITAIPVDSEQNLLKSINTLSFTPDALVIIGHGNWEGIQIADSVTSWEDLSNTLFRLDTQNIVLLSCLSTIASLLIEEKFGVLPSWYTFDTQIDYHLATFSSALFIATNLHLASIISNIQGFFQANFENIIKISLFSSETLWAGNTHNQIGSLAEDYYKSHYSWAYDWFGYYGAKNIIDDMHSRMDAADSYDDVDLVTADPASLFFNGPRRDMWLKHNYGMRFGIAINVCALFWCYNIYNLGVIWGTSTQATQTEFDRAVSYFRNGNYVSAAEHIAYAGHYVQDMSNPYHVYDYPTTSINVGDPLSAISTLTTLLNDLVGVVEHNNVEQWVSGHQSTAFSGVSPSSIPYYSSVSSYASQLAIWTKNQVPKSTADQFQFQSDSWKQNLVRPLLTKAIEYTVGLYYSYYLVC